MAGSFLIGYLRSFCLHRTHTPETQNADTLLHLGSFVALSLPLASLFTDRQQLQLACVLSTAAFVPDTEPIIALSQNTRVRTHIHTHSQRVHTLCVWALI